MKDLLRTMARSAALSLAGGLVAFVPATSVLADEPTPPSDSKSAVANKDKSVPTYDLLAAAKQGLVTVKAEGLGDGRMTLSVHNRTKKELRVVLPPGLIASGASGQFGGMGGMGGGGMGGGGMGGGGMGGGGMGGGMGGGGMGGGMGGGGGGMGGGMGGGGMGGGMGGTMPASMGMRTLGMLIMNLIGDRDSWDMSSLMQGGMGGMGGGGMGGGMGGGGMGGGMGGMGGGMGGGMRSVPPTGPAFADLKANQTRSLPTRLASLSAPTGVDGKVTLPEKGERLRLSDLSDSNFDARSLKALTRLGQDKAPETLATLVMWNVASGLDWATIKDKSKGWANDHELSLAQSFVATLDTLPKGETGALLYEIKGSSAASSALAKELSAFLKDRSVLGLSARSGVPATPDAPAVACKIVVEGTVEKPETTVFVATSDGAASAWVPTGKFTLPIALDGGKPKAAEFADALAEGLLGRLVRAQISKTSAMAKGKPVYKVRIDNASPLILNGLALIGSGKSKTETTPKIISGFSLSPRKSMSLPITGDMVDQFGLRKDVRVIAADLSGL